jgi:hypothetical protein
MFAVFVDVFRDFSSVIDRFGLALIILKLIRIWLLFVFCLVDMES